ncbi:MAG: HAMP domain-containing histidine kinase [Bacteroides sp.]|nr:HAMP domain-containing histidine kinase [Bacteroides sp.]
MKKLLIVLSFLSLLLPAQALNADKAQLKDSLLRVYLTSAPDTTRLEALYKISLLEPQTPTLLYYQDKLLKEAIAQKEVRYQSLALYSYIMYYYNRLNEKHTAQGLHALELLAQESGYYVDYYKAKKMLIELYTVNHKIELAINQSLDMYEKAKQLHDRNSMRDAHLCLLSGYFETMRYKEGKEALNKALELIHPEDSPLDKIALCSKAVLVYVTLQDDDTFFKYLQLMEEATSEFFAPNQAILSNAYPELPLFIETYYALYYIRKQQPDKAQEYLQKAETYMQASAFIPYQVAYLTTCAEYYRLIKEYEKSLTYWNVAIRKIKPFSPKDAMTYSIQKADLLVEMGQSEEALPLYKKVIKAKDSLYNDLATSQMEEIQSLYNMDKLVLQKEQQRSMFHYICLAISLITIIALSLFNIHIYRSRKRLQKDEQEMRRLTAIAEEANDVKSRFLANMSYNIRIPLNNVVGFSQLMTESKGLDEEEKKEYSCIIQHNSTELIRLVNDMLDLSHLEANMMKFQLQDCNVQEWCNDLACMVPMHSEGNIKLQLHVEAGDAIIHTDVNRLTQIVSSMLLYTDDCKKSREIKMDLIYHPEMKEITCRIENSPLADPAFASQKVSIRQHINELFFKHFNGTYRIEEGEGIPAIFFTYPTLTN